MHSLISFANCFNLLLGSREVVMQTFGSVWPISEKERAHENMTKCSTNFHEPIFAYSSSTACTSLVLSVGIGTTSASSSWSSPLASLTISVGIDLPSSIADFNFRCCMLCCGVNSTKLYEEVKTICKSYSFTYFLVISERLLQAYLFLV